MRQRTRIVELERTFAQLTAQELWIELNDNKVSWKVLSSRKPMRSVTFPTIKEAIKFFHEKVENVPEIRGWALVSDILQIDSDRPFIEPSTDKLIASLIGVVVSYVGWNWRSKDLSDWIWEAYARQHGLTETTGVELMTQLKEKIAHSQQDEG